MKRSDLRNMILEELSKQKKLRQEAGPRAAGVYRQDRQNIDNAQSLDDIGLQNNAEDRLKFSLGKEAKKIREYSSEDLLRTGEPTLDPNPNDARVYGEASSKELVSKEQAQQVYQKLGYKFDPIQFWKGMNSEMEHKDVTNGDPIMTGKIAAAHLREIPNYYELLEKYVEKKSAGSS